MRTGWFRRLLLAATLTLAAGQLAAPRAAVAAPTVRLVPVIGAGLASPVFATHAGDGTSRLFVVEQPGRIRIVTNKRLATTPFLDISGRLAAGGERGLLGLAFHPRYRTNGRFYVDYTRAGDGATVVSEFRVSADPAQALADSERVLLVVPQPYSNHNGGMIAFDKAGRLFIALGDGGSGGDPENRAQNPDELLGKILRIDVDSGTPYAIPSDNPFAGGGGRPEIYALGFRNPWRFSFDRGTGRLYAGDVGQGASEEIDLVQRGRNYGWRITEGFSCYDPPRGCDITGLTLPVVAYAHTSGTNRRCSVTGGYLYRGSAMPALRGTYIYGDYCSGEIFGWKPGGGRPRVLLDTDLNISSFGEDKAGELHVLGIGGTVHRLAQRGG